jgi:hypothetical protein
MNKIYLFYWKMLFETCSLELAWMILSIVFKCSSKVPKPYCIESLHAYPKYRINLHWKLLINGCHKLVI